MLNAYVAPNVDAEKIRAALRRRLFGASARRSSCPSTTERGDPALQLEAGIHG